jgi:hypothetical protein
MISGSVSPEKNFSETPGTQYCTMQDSDNSLLKFVFSFSAFSFSRCSREFTALAVSLSSPDFLADSKMDICKMLDNRISLSVCTQ